jgi:hypothetical protein
MSSTGQIRLSVKGMSGTRPPAVASATLRRAGLGRHVMENRLAAIRRKALSSLAQSAIGGFFAGRPLPRWREGRR